MVNAHAEWNKKSNEIIKAGKKIYKKSKNFDPTIDLDKVGSEIFDMLNEEDHILFRKERLKIAKKYKLFIGVDNK